MRTFKTYELTFWTWDDNFEEYDDICLGCGENEIGLNKALYIFKATTPTEKVPVITITEYTYKTETLKMLSYKVIYRKETNANE